MKKENGITMVSLVVTIVVLIILAGISIHLILGDNGIITIAKKAKENTELAKTEEETELNELYTQLENNGGTSGGTTYDAIAKLTEFKTAIANAIDEAGGVKPDTTAETAVFANNIKGIVKEVTKDATATASDIAEGKTAWVNGELITGDYTKNSTEEDIVIESVYFLSANPKYTFEEKAGYKLIAIYAEINGFSDKYTTATTTFKINKDLESRTISVGTIGSINVVGNFYAVYKNSDN